MRLQPYRKIVSMTRHLDIDHRYDLVDTMEERYRDVKHLTDPHYVPSEADLTSAASWAKRRLDNKIRK
jgi:hypothetical protein